MRSKNIIKILVQKDKPVDLLKLDDEIGKEMGWTRHGSKKDTNCYCGLSFSKNTHYEDGKLCDSIEVIWTRDGVNGYPIGDPRSGIKNLSKAEINKLKEALRKHNG